MRVLRGFAASRHRNILRAPGDIESERRGGTTHSSWKDNSYRQISRCILQEYWSVPKDSLREVQQKFVTYYIGAGISCLSALTIISRF